MYLPHLPRPARWPCLVVSAVNHSGDEKQHHTHKSRAQSPRPLLQGRQTTQVRGFRNDSRCNGRWQRKAAARALMEFSTFVAKLTLTDPDKTAPPNSAPPLTSLAAWRFAYSALFTKVPAPKGTTARDVRHAPRWTDEHTKDPDTGSTRNGFLASSHWRLRVHVDSGRGALVNPAQ